MPRAATTATTSDLGELQRHLRGDVVLPHHAGYADACRVFNAMIDKRPAAIAYCTSADDVTAAVTFARLHDVPLSVRAGGHNVAGCCVCDRGLVIDVSPMKAISVDPDSWTARAGAGLKLGEFDAATQRYHLPPPWA